MAAAGIKTCEESIDKNILKIEKTRRVLNMAFDIMEYTNSIGYGPYGNKIDLKIGIHTGKVIAGVIGFHKPQFSLIGDTVNTTSRVCSTGEISRITISEEAWNCVKGCELIFQKKIISVI